MPVNPIWSWEGAANSTVAYLTGGNGGGYGWSIDNGVRELELYLNHRYDKKCPDSLIVIGGYSQGAQVVGTLFSPEYNSKLVGDNIKKRITYITLFGDPKLNLPEGGFNFASWGRRVACHNTSQNSWWRGNDIDCAVTAGSLGGRKPYFTDYWMNKAKLWCYKDDPVCDVDSNLNNIGDHFKYANTDRIENGVREALFHTVSRFSGEERNKLLASVRNNGQVSQKQIRSDKPIDWSKIYVPWKSPEDQRKDPVLPCKQMYIFDTSTNEAYLNRQKLGYSVMAKRKFVSNKCKSGVAVIGPAGTSYYAKILLPLTHDTDLFVRTAASVQYRPEKTAPAGELLNIGRELRTPAANAIDVIIKSTSWPPYSGDNLVTIYAGTNNEYWQSGEPRAGLSDMAHYIINAIIPYADMGLFIPRFSDYYFCFGPWSNIQEWGSNNDHNVQQRMRQKVYADFNLYSDSGGYCASRYAGASKSNSVSMNLSPLENIGDTDVLEEQDIGGIRLANADYSAKPGEEISFVVDTKNPAHYADEYGGFVWYFGDESEPVETRTNEISHIYEKDFSGTVTVMALDKESKEPVAETSVPVKIGQESQEITRPLAATDLSLKKTSDTSALLSWKAQDNSIGSWTIWLNEGVIGGVPAAQNSVEIRDLDFTKPFTMAIQGISEAGYRSDMVYISYDDGVITHEDNYNKPEYIQKRIYSSSSEAPDNNPTLSTVASSDKSNDASAAQVSSVEKSDAKNISKASLPQVITGYVLITISLFVVVWQSVLLYRKIESRMD